MTRLPVFDLPETAAFGARAAVCAAVAGVVFALGSLPGYPPFLNPLGLIVPGVISALLSAPGLRRLSYLANAAASSLAGGYVSTLHIGAGPYLRPIFHPLAEFAIVASAIAAATALFGLVLLLGMRLRRRWQRS